MQFALGTGLVYAWRDVDNTLSLDTAALGHLANIACRQTLRSTTFSPTISLPGPVPPPFLAYEFSLTSACKAATVFNPMLSSGSVTPTNENLAAQSPSFPVVAGALFRRRWRGFFWFT